MALPDGLRALPGELIPSGLVAAGSRDGLVAEVLFEQRRREGVAYCRTLAAVYALHRAMYADDEAAFLAQPADFAEAVQARRRLAAAEIALNAQVSTLLRLGPAATQNVIELAVGYVERLPGVFALIGENVISPKAGEVALRRSQVLTAEQIHEFDVQLCARLTREYEVLSLPDLKDVADVIVTGIDPEAAERRRKEAVEDRRVSFRADEDGMVAAFALLPAHEGAELRARLDHIVGTVCDQDPRTAGQRRADGLMQLSRGYGTLGCDCAVEGCRYRQARYQGEPDADGVLTRFITLINVVLNDQDLAVPEAEPAPAAQAATRAATRAAAPAASTDPEPTYDRNGAEPDTPAPSGAAVPYAPEQELTRFGYLEGYGPISAEYARELAGREDAKIRPFGRRIPDDDIVLDEPALVELNLDESAVGDAVADAGATPTAPRMPTIEDVVHGSFDVTPIWNRIVLNFTPHTGPDGGGFPFNPEPEGPDGPGGPGGPLDPRPHQVDPPGSSAARTPASLDILSDSRGTGVPAPEAAAPRPIVEARGAGGYRPSVDLRRYLRMLMPRCVFPHCTRPTARAQIDHRREFDHRAPELGGSTTADQIQPLCIAHHQLKTAGEWIDARMPDGRVLWTSPDGRRYIVDPTGLTLQLFPDLARVRWTVPEGRGPGPDTPPPGGRTRLQREHARRERRRRANIAALEADIAHTTQPRSTVEKHLTETTGAMPPTPPATAYDGPPPF